MMEQNHLSNKEQEPLASDALKSETLPKIISLKNINKVVPIISNSFRIEQIFRNEKSMNDLVAKRPIFTDEELTISDRLTRIWAHQIRYPMTDDYKLWRVAQYYQVEKDGADTAKEDYLDFLKKLLLDINENREGYQDFVKTHRKDAHWMSFSQLVKGLDLPFPGGTRDPLDMLVRLPFPVYITTSYYDFIERAIERASEGRIKPRTQVIFWDQGKEYDDAVDPNHYPDPSFKPSAEEPAVYHLFGLENYPSSLVLSEDDYIKFLISVVSITDNQQPIVPPRLRQALSSAHLLLLGYHLRDWDFRVLFRFILNCRQSEAKKGICIQLKPKTEDEQLLKYLRNYFNMKKFEIEWKSSEEFIRELWEFWKVQQQ